MKHAADLSCPVCHAPLIAERRQDVEIDECPQCRGVWLDRNELDKIMDRERPLPPAGIAPSAAPAAPANPSQGAVLPHAA